MTTNSANTANTAIAKEAVETNGAQSQQTDPPTLQLDNVSYAYTKGGKRVLKNISHDFQAGKVHAITGPSGAGKTTLLQIVGTLSCPDAGRVEIDGQDAFSLGDKALSRFRNERIGFVFQFHHLLPEFTAFENVCIPGLIGRRPRADVERRASELLDMMGLAARRDHKPGQLSGGEQQRVAIARALAKNPKLLLCDEPTGALDYKTGKQILQLLQDTCRKQGITVIIITHNSALAPMADRLIRFKSGRVESETVQQNPVSIETIEW